jgi:hypothetical protein
MTRYTRTERTPNRCTIKSITLGDYRVIVETVTGKTVPMRIIGTWKDKVRWVENAVATFNMRQV